MKIVIGAIIGLLLAGGAAWFFLGGGMSKETPTPTPAATPEPEVMAEPEPEPEPEETAVEPDPNVYGYSVDGRELRFTQFGNGEKELVLIGGIHGGYEWNTVTLADKFIEYFTENPDAIPEDVTVTIIPVANPDGLYEVVAVQEDGSFTSAMIAENTAPGRFNTHIVDLNRNFDCKWQPKATWRSEEVSAGTAAFSEPEAAALRDLFVESQPELVVFWHSASNGVYGSQCEDGILPDTVVYGEAYSTASGYPWTEVFEHYEVTGDAADWLATIGIPSISVELLSHETVEWEQNLAGVNALFEALSPTEEVVAAE